MAKKVCSIRMSESLLALLDEQSKEKGVDRNTLIVNLLTEGVGGSVQTKEDFLQTKLEALINQRIDEFAAAYDGKVKRMQDEIWKVAPDTAKLLRELKKFGYIKGEDFTQG